MNTRDDVFDRVRVDYLVRGTARVSWDLRPGFRDPAPHTFQLQARDDGGLAWANVGAPVVNLFQATDATNRLYGTLRRVEYRVTLTTAVGYYESPTALVLGDMTQRLWLQARNMIRARKAAVGQRGVTALRGYLLKRKIAGTPCTTCLDPDTGRVLRSDCPTCQGTRFVTGYWRSVENSMIDLSPGGSALAIQPPRGTVDPDNVRQGLFVGLPTPDPQDVWVLDGGDRRFVVDRVKVLAEVNGVPVVVAAVLAEEEQSSPIYALDL